MRYICMPPLNRHTSPPHDSTGLLNACPTCGVTCWDREVPEELKLENKPYMKLCTECAIRKVTGKPQAKAVRRQERRCG